MSGSVIPIRSQYFVFNMFVMTNSTKSRTSETPELLFPAYTGVPDQGENQSQDIQEPFGEEFQR